MHKRKFIVESPEKLFFTADQHFCHSYIIRACNRPFANVEEMNAILIDNWQKTVSEDDDIIILGDIFWQEKFEHKYLEILKSLSGKKHLVLGNHDYFENEWYLNHGFASVNSYIEVLVGKNKIVCFHYPIHEWNGFYKKSLHFHGHTHGNFKSENNRVLDVGVDTNNFKPVRWLDLKFSHI